ncbi:uncharacterized protein LOC126741477 isoform X2 [Anthonomus grandis grandis]|uniref:uncharacterized protein LOC126741477 isoform X2 n=1 Tax=Anthonomus grandis grandis TaxID=2921223 RepID=UPI0021660B33|nr:uncharacterized protein LOC126741477 isoform X2 [Anthonomus grandis grandis]
MEISRGICVLCLNSTKIVVPPQAEDIMNLLCEIMEGCIDTNKFQKTKTTLKACPCCLDVLIQVHKYKQNIKEFSEDSGECCLCHESENLVSISDWTNFDNLLANIEPNLMVKQPIKKESSSTQKRRSFKNKTSVLSVGKSLKNLKPITYSRLSLDIYKDDEKLTKQIPFVNLVQYDFSDANIKSEKSLDDTDSSPNECSFKSFFKIKLKANRSTNRSKIQRVSAGRVTKPRRNMNFSVIKKELIVKIAKIDLKTLESLSEKHKFESLSDENYLLSRSSTPTKASRKMMPEETLNISKTRKSVTFNEDLNEIITDCVSIANENSVRKSAVKNSGSTFADILDIDDDNPLQITPQEVDSDDEIECKKSYVEDIKQNNDSIFESLKSSTAIIKPNGTQNSREESETTTKEKVISSPDLENECSKVDNDDKECILDITDNDRISVASNSDKDLTDNEELTSKFMRVANNTSATVTLKSDSEEDFMLTLKQYNDLKLSGSESKKSDVSLKKRRFSLMADEVDEIDQKSENKKSKVSEEETVESSNHTDNVSEPTNLSNTETNVVSNNPVVKNDNNVLDENVESDSKLESEDIVNEKESESVVVTDKSELSVGSTGINNLKVDGNAVLV